MADLSNRLKNPWYPKDIATGMLTLAGGLDIDEADDIDLIAFDSE